MEIQKNVMRLFNIACQSECLVLISGPTGTGKTTLAKMIHQQSSRKGGPFISVNLATLHEGVLESELFGHEKGSFTGADQRRTGKLELAQGGTVFLDEIGELTPRLQARLLEFLQTRTISPVGSNRELKLDVRVIAATHKDLVACVERREFRSDLFHRLRVVSIYLNPLREQLEHLDTIVHSCLQDVCRQLGRSILKISPAVAERLEVYDWPGNIRELRNVLEYAVLASQKQEIVLDDLPSWMMTRSGLNLDNIDQGIATLGVAEISLTLDYQKTLEQFEKEYLRRALSRYQGRITRTANKIGLNKTTLLRRVKAYGLSECAPPKEF